MAPRPIGELFSVITASDVEQTVIKSFTDNLNEIFTHPQKDITNHLVQLSDTHATSLRRSLYDEIVDQAPSVYKDDLQKMGFSADVRANNLKGRLIKRYKTNIVYEDIYCLGISLVEKSLHKDFKKLVTPPKKVSKHADSVDSTMEVPAGTSNNNCNNNPAPSPIHSSQVPFIDILTELKSLVTASRQENKELKSKIDLLTTKVDRQSQEITSQKQEIVSLRKLIIDKNNCQPAVGAASSGAPSPRDSPSTGCSPSPRDLTSPPQEPSLLQQLQQQQLRYDQRQLNIEQQRQHQQQLEQNGHQAQTPSSWSNTSAISRDTPRTNGVKHFGSTIQPTQCPAGHRRDCVNKVTCFFRHIGENVGDPVPEGWNLVTHKKRKPPLYGSKRDTTTAIAGQRTVREMSIFIGGINNQLSVDDFSKHVQEHLHVTPVQVSQNKKNNYNQSFKLTINSTDKMKIFDPEKWEENIIIKPFRERKAPQNNGYPNTETFNSYRFNGPSNFY